MAKTRRRDENLLEPLSKHIERIEKFELGTLGDDIVVSSAHKVSALVEDLGIRKTPIPWPLYRYNMFYIVSVPGGTVVPVHEHDEAVFRLVIEGSLLINGRFKVEAGEWCVIKAGVRYEIKTSEGYRALSGYTSNCRTRRGHRPSKVPRL